MYFFLKNATPGAAVRLHWSVNFSLPRAQKAYMSLAVSETVFL